MKPKMLYVSNNAVSENGRESPFLQQEKEWLLSQFGEFRVVCDTGVYNCKQSGELVFLFRGDILNRLKCVVKSVTDVNIYKELLHALSDHKISLKNVLKIFKYSYDAAVLYSYIISEIVEGDVLYSYWFSYDAYACAMVKKVYDNTKAISRAHAYEIQINRNACNPYLMKRFTCEQLDEIAFISQNSLACFTSYYHEWADNFTVRYLGSTRKGTGFRKRKKSGKLVIVSCSSIVPIKRLDRLINVINKWNSVDQLHWIHVGDGPQAMTIRQLASNTLDKNPYVTYEFLGHLDNLEVHDVLSREYINIFVNTSDAEGIPVSIMEAMSVGLPVIAPKIFGIPEIIDEKCGLLFSVENAENSLLECLKKIDSMTDDKRNEMGRNAFEKWEKEFCLEKNLSTLFSEYL